MFLQPFIEFAFMRQALVACLILSCSLPAVGVFLMLRRMGLTGDAIAHGILPGVALAYLVAGLSISAMTLGGVLAGMCIVLGSGWISRRTRLREDTSLAAFYLLSLALGVLIISQRGGSVDLLHVLFGNILALDQSALLLLGLIATATLLGLALLYRPLVLECLDPGFLRRSSRLSPWAHYGFLSLLVLNLVAGFQALGTLMAVGLMILPAAAARFWTRTLGSMLLCAAALGLLGGSTGLLLSWHLEWATGPTIVLTLGLLYLLSALAGREGLIRPLLHPHRHLRA